MTIPPGRAGDSSITHYVRRFEMASAFVSALITFITAFHTASSWASQITCEMQVFYLYYRIGIMFGVWLPFGIREVADLFSTFLLPLVPVTSEGNKHTRTTDQVARHLLSYGWGVCGRFVETLGCSIFMNFVFWFSCNIFWAADFNYAIKYYLWGFINDVFGVCAASGYKDVYGWSCLPPTQFFSETTNTAVGTVIGLLLAPAASAIGVAAAASLAVAVSGIIVRLSYSHTGRVLPPCLRGDHE